MNDKRKFERYPYIEMIKMMSLKKQSYFSRSYNLSKGGMFIHTDTPWEPGTQGWVILTVKKESSKEELQLKFVVAHNEPLAETLRGMGIEFSELTDHQSQVLDEIVAECNEFEE